MQIVQRVLAFLNWHRRLVAALCAATCVYGIVHVFSQETASTVKAVVAAKEIPVGATISKDSLLVTDLPAEFARADTFEHPEELAKAHSLIPLAPGQLLYGSAVSFPGNAPPGRSLVPVSVRDEALRSLLVPGARVNLVMALEDTPEVVASGVISAPPQQQEKLSKLTTGGGLVIVEVSTELAATVSVLGQSGQLSFVLTG